jgi:hypothetical protein
MTISRTDPNGGKLRLNKIEFFIEKCGNQELTAAMNFTKAEENKEFLLRTKPNGSQLDIKNTHFDCIRKRLFFIDLHLNLPPFRTDPFMPQSPAKMGRARIWRVSRRRHAKGN